MVLLIQVAQQQAPRRFKFQDLAVEHVDQFNQRKSSDEVTPTHCTQGTSTHTARGTGTHTAQAVHGHTAHILHKALTHKLHKAPDSRILKCPTPGKQFDPPISELAT